MRSTLIAEVAVVRLRAVGYHQRKQTLGESNRDKTAQHPLPVPCCTYRHPSAVVALLDDFGEGLSIRIVKVGVNLVEKKEMSQTPDTESQR
jgi:hypothetical protein